MNDRVYGEFEKITGTMAIPVVEFSRELNYFALFAMRYPVLGIYNFGGGVKVNFLCQKPSESFCFWKNANLFLK